MNIHTKLAPDFNRLLKVLKRDGIPDRVPFIELLFDAELMSAMTGEKFPTIRGIFEHGLRQVDRETEKDYYLKEIKLWYEAGFDYISVRPFIPLLFPMALTADTAENSRGDRSWQSTGHGGIITSEEEFDKYPWPTAEDVDYWNVEFVAKHLPDGIKIITTTYGILEVVMWLMGYSTMALALYTEPELIERMFNRVGELFLGIYKNVSDMDRVGAVWMGDDMGFKSATLISPQHLRQHVFPWTKRCVQTAHGHNLPFLLHSCGNREGIMDDLIDDVKIDAIHSFEDVIMPVTEAKKRYGDRVAILGGIDMDILARAGLEEADAYIRGVLDQCAPGGGYALGSGNSAANYLNVANYQRMLQLGYNYKY